MMPVPETIHQLGMHTHFRFFDLFSFLLGLLIGAVLVYLIANRRRRSGWSR